MAHTYYACREPDGMFTIRQSRFRGRKPEHPHDVMAIGRDLNELRRMAELYFDGGENSVDWTMPTPPKTPTL
jgi:hypothetical protein